MTKRLLPLALLLCFGVGTCTAKPLSEAQIRQAVIQQSIAAYPGNCPCPYNTASNGSRCGKRSAYSRPGGERPLCFAADVSAERVRDFKAQQGVNR